MRFDCRTCAELRLLNFIKAGYRLQAPLEERCRHLEPDYDRACRWRHFPDFSSWNGARDPDGGRRAVGSQNFAQLAEPAVGHYRFHVELAKVERREGLGSREILSRLYWPAILVGWMTSLALARREDDRTGAGRIRRALRAYWTLLSLLAQPTPIGRLQKLVYDRAPESVAGNARYYTGPEVYSGGERFNEGCLVDGPLGMLLACALAWSGRRRERRRYGGLQSVLLVVEALAEMDPFENDVQARVFGLNLTERQTLRQVVSGDVDAAARAFEAWLKPWPIFRPYRILSRRTRLGTEVIFLRSTNGNKPAAAYASLTAAGDARVVIPDRFQGRGANRGWRVEFDLETVVAQAGAGSERRVNRLGGEGIWELELVGEGEHRFVPLGS